MSIADKLTQVAENVSKVHNSGKKAEYDAFWDAYQDYGKRVNYYQTFGFGDSASLSPWTNQNFKPKFPIKPSYVNNMCTNFGYRGDITEAAEFDFSDAWALYNAFVNCPWITRVGTIDCRGMQEGGGAIISNCPELETIDKFIFRDDGLQPMSSNGLLFTNCTSLKNIVFEGTVNFNVNFQWCPLTKSSITSVINALHDKAINKSVTFNKNAKESAFTDTEWAELIASKPNWTFSLI